MAYQLYKRASDLAPTAPAVWHNLGKTMFDCRRLDEAETCFRRALKLKPDFANSLDGMALISLNRCEYDLAMDYAERALKIDPKMLESQINRGMCRVAKRQWREGWPDYNQNIGTDANRKEIIYGSETRWNGEKDKTVICYGDQGIGDEISFASCLPDLIRDSKQVVIDCDGRLKHLFRRSFPQCRVYGNRYAPEGQPWHAKYQFNHRVPLGALPQFYRNADADFPGTPYLVPNPEMNIQWRALLDSLGPGLKVGISWTGGTPNSGRTRRSVTLETLLPILKLPCHWVSLQYQDPRDDIEAFHGKHGIKIHHWPHGTQLFDYDCTVSLISQLDLVISVTTTAIHAAGSIGKECWCLVPEKPMWRYGGKSEDFPWAKSVTLYRQKGKEWPIHILAGKLRDKIGDR